MIQQSEKNKKAVLRFIGYSLLGIFVFFFQIDIGGNKSIPIDHMIVALKSWLNSYYPLIICIISGYFVLKKIVKGTIGKQISDRIFFLQALLGFLISGAILLKIGSKEFLEIGTSSIQATGNIVCAIFLTSVFIPFLVEYGLVDATGIVCRPFMRKLFHTPGSSAVIGVSAFLGNYSTGHVISRKMYEEGRFTERESVIVALGFSTCSIGLMLNLANYLNLMEYWSEYVFCILIITFITTAIVSRIFPICSKKDAYKEGVTPIKESISSEQLWSNAWHAGIEKAAKAPRLIEAVKDIQIRVFPVICGITATSVFVITCGFFAASYTNLFFYLGSPFYFLLKIVGIVGEEIGDVIQAIGACILEPVLSGTICDGKELSMKSRWIVGVVPYSAIIFFAGSIPSAWASKINCKTWEMIIIWAERVTISIVLSTITAKILFG